MSLLANRIVKSQLSNCGGTGTFRILNGYSNCGTPSSEGQKILQTNGPSPEMQFLSSMLEFQSKHRICFPFLSFESAPNFKAVLAWIKGCKAVSSSSFFQHNESNHSNFGFMKNYMEFLHMAPLILFFLHNGPPKKIS